MTLLVCSGWRLRRDRGIEAGASSSSGTRADIKIASAAACQRISSVYIQTTLGGSYEFGYTIGWSTCTHDGSDGTFYSQPTLFWWSYTNGGDGDCNYFQGYNPTPEVYETFRASDLNQNTYWGAWYNGTELDAAGENLDFSQGTNAIGVERGSSADNSFSRFTDLDEWLPTSTWSHFDGLDGTVDTDPDYYLEVLDAFTGRVVQ